MKEDIWNHLAQNKGNKFFVTAEFIHEDQFFPESLDSFILQKTKDILEKGITGRKFIFKEGNWKIYLTFFPTDEVVDEKYALKNKFHKRQIP